MKLRYDSKEWFLQQIAMTENITGKQVKVKKRKRKADKYPSAKERVYKKFVRKVLSDMTGYVRKVIIPALPALLSKYRGDAVEWEGISEYVIPPEPGDWDLLIKGLQNVDDIIFVDNRDLLRARLEELGEGLWADNLDDFREYVRTLTGITPMVDETLKANLIELFVNTNTELIRGAGQDMIKNTSTVISQGIQSGESAASIAEKLRKLSDKYEGYRADLIARDQVSKYWADLSRRNQQSIGVERYIWRTSKDERVRATHSPLEGKYCRWDDPTVYSDDGKEWKSRSSIGAVELHPGQDIQCRCYSEMVLEDIIGG